MRQYPSWQKEIHNTLYLKASELSDRKVYHYRPSPVEYAVMKLEKPDRYIHLVASTISDVCCCDPELSKVFLGAVIGGTSYDSLVWPKSPLCSREEWYNMYHKFFYLLDKRRD